MPNDEVTTVALISTMFKQMMFPNEKDNHFDETLIMRFMQRLGHRSSRMREGNIRYYGYAT